MHLLQAQVAQILHRGALAVALKTGVEAADADAGVRGNLRHGQGLMGVVALIVDALWESTKLGAGAYLAAALTLAGLAVSTLGRVRQGKQEERARRAEPEPPEK